MIAIDEVLTRKNVLNETYGIVAEYLDIGLNVQNFTCFIDFQHLLINHLKISYCM